MHREISNASASMHGITANPAVLCGRIIFTNKMSAISARPIRSSLAALRALPAASDSP
jgi:hypothetical protein